MLLVYALLEGDGFPFESVFIAMLLGVLMFLSAMLGGMVSNSLQFTGIIGVLFGFIVFVSFNYANLDYRKILSALNIVLFFHIALWSLQVFVFMATGEYLDYVSILSGEPSRFLFATYGFEITRFTGAFVEPAHLATFMFMGLTIRLVSNDFAMKKLDYLVVFCAISSLSIYGIFLILIALSVSVVQVLIVRNKLGSLRFPLAMIGLGFALSVFYFDDYFQTRVVGIFSDPSGMLRLFGGFYDFYELSDYAMVFGVGVGNYENIGAAISGLTWALQQVGIFGVFLLLTFFAVGLLNCKYRFFLFVCFFVTLLGTPLFTNIFWWVWIALLRVLSTYSLRELRET